MRLRHLKYLRSNSLMTHFGQTQSMDLAFALWHCTVIWHWLGGPESHLSKDNTSVPMSSNSTWFVREELSCFVYWLNTVQGSKCDTVLLIPAETSTLVDQTSGKVQSHDWLCSTVSGFIPFALIIGDASRIVVWLLVSSTVDSKWE